MLFDDRKGSNLHAFAAYKWLLIIIIRDKYKLTDGLEGVRVNFIFSL